MFWKRTWDGWRWLAGAFVCCAAAFLLNGQAWQAGYEADVRWLYASNFLSLPLLFLAWCMFIGPPFAPADLEGAGRQPSLAPVHCLGCGIAFVGACCVISHYLWFVILPLVALVLLGQISFARQRQGPAWEGLVGRQSSFDS